MAGQIRLTPEQLHSRAGEFRTEGQNFADAIGKMQNLIGALQDEWEGQASQEFANQFAQLRPSFDKVRDLVDDIAKQLDGTAEAVAQLDRDIAGKFKV